MRIWLWQGGTMWSINSTLSAVGMLWGLWLLEMHHQYCARTSTKHVSANGSAPTIWPRKYKLGTYDTGRSSLPLPAGAEDSCGLQTSCVLFWRQGRCVCKHGCADCSCQPQCGSVTMDVHRCCYVACIHVRAAARCWTCLFGALQVV